MTQKNILFSIKNLKNKVIYQAEAQNFATVLERAIKEKIDLTYANFDMMDISGANLQGANLKHASFRGCDLQNTNLSNTNLEYAVLDYADLHEANLSNANLKSTSCFSTIFEAVDLKNTDFKNADFTNVKKFETAKNIAFVKNTNSLKNAPSYVKSIINKEKSRIISEKISSVIQKAR